MKKVREIGSAKNLGGFIPEEKKVHSLQVPAASPFSVSLSKYFQPPVIYFQPPEYTLSHLGDSAQFDTPPQGAEGFLVLGRGRSEPAARYNYSYRHPVSHLPLKSSVLVYSTKCSALSVWCSRDLRASRFFTQSSISFSPSCRKKLSCLPGANCLVIPSARISLVGTHSMRIRCCWTASRSQRL